MNADVRRIRAMRLRAQGLVPGARTWATPSEVARGMLAMQAQDPKGVLWALALRCAEHPTEAEVLAEMAEGRVVRNRPSRGTLQVTAPEDLHWLSETMTPRSIAAAVKRRGQIGVTEEMVAGVGEVLRRELADGVVRTRPEIVEACAAADIDLDGTQAGHVLRHHTEVMTIVFAEPEGRTDTFALAEHWIDDARELDHDDALAELGQRYVEARGPVTAADLGRWANLTMGDARAAIAGAGDALTTVTLDGDEYVVAADAADLGDDDVDGALDRPLLLPPFDEYLLGYGSRSSIIDDEHFEKVVPGRNGMFKPIVVVDGEIVGIWSRKLTAKKATVTVEPFGSLSAPVKRGLAEPAEAYARFLERTPALEFA
ncbi:MAG: AlkZ family DNA glycosylase [Actinobacteria bacterium]|nr:AlkZ family DNA glycosylase [Actinomycetota bacterium]